MAHLGTSTVTDVTEREEIVAFKRNKVEGPNAFNLESNHHCSGDRVDGKKDSK